ncbi:MAG TPA: DUF4845 domain-containing protein [Methylotenera sp.]|nr:DUF4845 domain-containing protein [Methylotenera sp.]
MGAQFISSRKNQRGATFLGMAIIGGILICAAIVGIKLATSYIEYMSVKKVIHAMAQESLNTMSKKDIKDAFTRRASIDAIHSVTADDLVIEKDGTGNTIVSAQYKVIKPLMGNVSVILDFATSSNSK